MKDPVNKLPGQNLLIIKETLLEADILAWI